MQGLIFSRPALRLWTATKSGMKINIESREDPFNSLKEKDWSDQPKRTGNFRRYARTLFVVFTMSLRLKEPSQSRTQTLYSRMASYIASGARSALFGHSIAPRTTRACAKIAGARSGSKIVPLIFGSLRNERISTSPVTPSTKATRSRESGKAVTDVTRHGIVCRIGGSTSGVRLLSGLSVGCIGSNSPSIHRYVR